MYESKGLTRLYDWQVEALAQPDVLAGGSLVYSAPTSAGKSLVADVLLLRSLLRSPRRGVLVVLPYNALCDEKAAGLERLAQPLGVQVHRHYSDRNGPLPSGELGIIVCTFEKANAIVARLIETDRLSAVGCVVVDELHMLSGASDACLHGFPLRNVVASAHAIAAPQMRGAGRRWSRCAPRCCIAPSSSLARPTQTCTPRPRCARSSSGCARLGSLSFSAGA